MPPSKPRGRPPLGPGRGSQGKSISTRVDLEEHARLISYCGAHGTTVARLLRELLARVIRP